LNLGALVVSEPVWGPLDFENHLKNDSLTHFSLFFTCTAISGPLLLHWFSLGIIAVSLVDFRIATEIVKAFSAGRSAGFVNFVADEASVLVDLILIAVVRQIHRLISPGTSQSQGGCLKREQSSQDGRY
jgi:hypothetical protein